MFGRKPLLDGVSLKDLVATLGITALGLLGWLPGLIAPERVIEPVNLLAWFALAAPAIGCVGGRLGLRFWPLGFVAPATWMGVYALSVASLLQSAPTPIHAALVWTGLFAAGWAVGAGAPRLGWAGPGLLLLLAAGLAQLPGLVTLLGEGASQTWITWALDLSPVTCVMESAGLDWMRHESVYELAGSLAPDARTPTRGMLAGPLFLLVGWVLVTVAERRSRDRAVENFATESSPGS